MIPALGQIEQHVGEKGAAAGMMVFVSRRCEGVHRQESSAHPSWDRDALYGDEAVQRVHIQ